ncbi:Uncharacterized protein SCF082_LOCUS12063 [Durusdinium trenchii]|uniref:RNase H type-1 domain-containing protein n=1 Tax=Durusdinium trenchii TaxID=1381693 RepID=A0ABP0JHH6_9DINO
MTQFAPAVIPLSFVDNIGLLAEEARHLAQGTLVLKEFLSLWKLEIDGKKSWTWSTMAADGPMLETLDYKVQKQAGDLGVQHSYSGARRISIQIQRLQALEGLWMKLKKLDAEPGMKQQLLISVFWPKAFHGISVCLLGKSHVDSLRTLALRALGYGKAGAAPLMRMALLDNLMCDPGFYQLTRVITDFRRMADKQDSVLTLWQQYWQAYSGKLQAGPFSKLLEVFEEIRWHVLEPPWVLPHEGHPIDLLAVPKNILQGLLESAWAAMVSRVVGKRKDFSGLTNLNRHVLLRARKNLTPLAKAQVSALQEGVFLTAKQQSKYDKFQSGCCIFCGCPDDLDHRVMHCPALSAAREGHDQALAEWQSLTVSRKHRLLPEAFPHWNEWLQMLGPIEPPCFSYQPCCTLEGWVDIFTDGPLSGPIQTVDRSEVTALLASLTWADGMNCKVTVWMDSAYAAVGLWRLIDSSSSLPYSSNEDLWLLCQERVKKLGSRLQGQHINSHRTESDCADAVDSWTMFWNGAADKAAMAAHSMHSAEKLKMWRSLCQHQEKEQERQERLQKLHIAVAEARRELMMQRDEFTREGEEQGGEKMEHPDAVREGDSSLFDLMPDTWHTNLGRRKMTWPDHCEGLTRRGQVRFGAKDGCGPPIAFAVGLHRPVPGMGITTTAFFSSTPLPRIKAERQSWIGAFNASNAFIYADEEGQQEATLNVVLGWIASVTLGKMFWKL